MGSIFGYDSVCGAGWGGAGRGVCLVLVTAG